MSVHSMIGGNCPHERYVYCQFDGYPTGVGNALRAIVDRDGAQQALATILDQGNAGGWLKIEADHQPRTWRHSVSVPGYGAAERARPDDPDLDLRTSLAEELIVFIYTIHPDGAITIHQRAIYGLNALRWQLKPGQSAHDNHPPRDAQPYTTD